MTSTPVDTPRPLGASAPGAPSPRGPRRDRQWVTYGCLALTIAVMAVFFVWPLVDIVLRSLDEHARASYGDLQLTSRHYEALLHDPVLRTVLENTLVISGLATLATLILGFPTAYLLSRLKPKVAAALYVLILVPFWVSILVRLFAWTQLLAKNGPVNEAAGAVHLGPWELLYNTPATVIGMVSYLLPFLILVLYSGMAGVDPSLTVAAKCAGASGWQAFRRIYLPLVRASVVGGTLLIFVIGLGFFLTPAVLGGTNDITVSTYIAQQVQNFQWGTASAVGVVLQVASIGVAIVALRIAGVGGLMGGNAGQKGAGRAEPLKFGPLTVVLWAFAFVSIAILLVPLLVVLPISVETNSFVSWPPRGFTMSWFNEIFTDPRWGSAASKSLRVGGMAALLSVVMGFVTARAMLTVRSSWLRSFCMALFYAPLVVPVILLAIGTFDTQTKLGLAGTSIGLAAVHATLALPFTMTIFLTALSSFDHRLEQAAWTLGASRATTLRRVVAPLIMPSALGAALLAFVTSWDETTVALFQITSDALTLPVLFFSFIKTGVAPTLAAIGVLLIASVIVVGGLTAVLRIYWQRRRNPVGPIANEAVPGHDTDS
jgi:putative spermidine/putrescine transport system permease protein